MKWIYHDLRITDGFVFAWLFACAVLVSAILGCVVFILLTSLVFASSAIHETERADTFGTYRAVYPRPREPGVMRCDVLLPFGRCENNVLIDYPNWDDRAPNDLWAQILWSGDIWVQGTFVKPDHDGSYAAVVLVRPYDYRRRVTARELSDVGGNVSKLPAKGKKP